jgi:hypothetical protein
MHGIAVTDIAPSGANIAVINGATIAGMIAVMTAMSGVTITATTAGNRLHGLMCKGGWACSRRPATFVRCTAKTWS